MPERIVLEIQARERAAAAARRRFENETALAYERRFSGPDAASTEVEIMNVALRLIEDSRSTR